jgi:hypothetical protein
VRRRATRRRSGCQTGLARGNCRPHA